jgi:hypothetical protein
MAANDAAKKAKAGTMALRVLSPRSDSVFFW